MDRIFLFSFSCFSFSTFAAPTKYEDRPASLYYIACCLRFFLFFVLASDTSPGNLRSRL